MLALLALPLLAGACSDATSPRSGARVAVVSGDHASDTIFALASAPLVVEVRDSSGQPARGVEVLFSSRVPTPADSFKVERGVYVCGAANVRCSFYVDYQNYGVSTEFSQLTDSSGQASIGVEYGVLAGRTAVEVSVPSLGVSTSAPFTTLPGLLDSVVAAVPDTAVYVGHSYRIVPTAADRFGNPRSERVTLRTLTPAVATINSGRVTTIAIGRARIAMTAGSIVDTAYASVPPQGRLVAFGGGLTLLNTDGSDRRSLIATGGDHGTALPVWTADGASIVFEELGTDETEQLQLVDTLGNRHPIFTPTDDVSRSIQPSIRAHDGVLFFSGQKEGVGNGIFSAGVEGTGLTFVGSGAQPAPSPDGLQLAYINGNALIVRGLSVGGESTIAQEGPAYPRWSPSGNLIAFSDNAGLHVDVIHPDGSGFRSLGLSTNSAVCWSPDSEWLVVARFGGNPGNRPSDAGFELIRVGDGERLPIPWTHGLAQVSWRPTG